MSGTPEVIKRRFQMYRGAEPVKSATVTQSDVEAIETAADALIRERHTQTALTLYALALRLRSETGIHPLRRSTDGA